MAGSNHSSPTEHRSVVLEGTCSETASVESGVPQGSVLGPSLFLYYINDMPESIKSKIRLFADDTIMYLAIVNDADYKSLQNDLSNLQEWETRWKMAFHPQKCQVLSVTKKKSTIIHDYKLHGHTLEHVKSAKYLGCTINDNMEWGEHINNITNKANQKLKFLRRNLNVASTTAKETAYKVIIRPSIEYASSVWDPYKKGQINKLEMIQRRSARFVRNNYHNRSSVTDMIAKLNWRSLEDRRKETRLTMLYKIYNEQIYFTNSSSYFIPVTRNSRQTDPETSFQLPQCRTQYRLNSFFPRTIRDWNKLPPDIQSVGSVDALKERLAQHCF